jgi:excisionase family DNA binding protein
MFAFESSEVHRTGRPSVLGALRRSTLEMVYSSPVSRQHSHHQFDRATAVETLSLQQAASFLRCHPEELRRRAKAGLIPGAKVGRAWVFLEEDLAGYLRSL